MYTEQEYFEINNLIENPGLQEELDEQVDSGDDDLNGDDDEEQREKRKKRKQQHQELQQAIQME